ncbi:MAG: carboxypeptidase regulatory-like domain-containing protein [Gammaproteobacteria bacterium]|nr:carboxypeptidase regulatory-like domain-containing protein [Gammaproteobacteria bacterium]
MNKKRLKWAGVIVALVAALMGYILWPASVTPTASGGPVSGRVIEDGSEKPIEGAIVTAWWRGSIAYSNTVCFHVATTITDAEGRYNFPAWSKKHKWGNSDGQQVYVRPHKAGYRRTGLRGKEKAYVQTPDTRSVKERLEYLLKILPGCGSDDESEKNLLPFYRVVYEEAKSIAVTKEDMRELNGILFGLETIEFGGEIAQERFLKRARELQ